MLAGERLGCRIVHGSMIRERRRPCQGCERRKRGCRLFVEEWMTLRGAGVVPQPLLGGTWTRAPRSSAAPPRSASPSEILPPVSVADRALAIRGATCTQPVEEVLPESHHLLHGVAPGGLVLVDDEARLALVPTPAVLIEEQGDAVPGPLFPRIRCVVADVLGRDDLARGRGSVTRVGRDRSCRRRNARRCVCRRSGVVRLAPAAGQQGDDHDRPQPWAHPPTPAIGPGHMPPC